MIRGSLQLLLVCPLFACASAPKERAPSLLENRDPYTFHVTVPSVPADASPLVVSVESPDPAMWPTSVHGLVGNAPFDVPLSPGCSFSNEQVSLSLEPLGDYVPAGWRLQVSTKGKPVELGLRLSVPKESQDAEHLHGALARNTTVSCGGRPIEASSSLERAK